MSSANGYEIRAGPLPGGGGAKLAPALSHAAASVPARAPAPVPVPVPAPPPAPAPRKPRATLNADCPLVALLETPGLSGKVLEQLTLREAMAVRGTCVAAAAAVSAHPFNPPCTRGRTGDEAPGWLDQSPILGGRNLVRFLAALPAAESVVVADPEARPPGRRRRVHARGCHSYGRLDDAADDDELDNVAQFLGEMCRYPWEAPSVTAAREARRPVPPPPVHDADLARLACKTTVVLLWCGALTPAGVGRMGGVSNLIVDGCEPLPYGPALEALPDPGALQSLRLAADVPALSPAARAASTVTDAHLGRFTNLRRLELECWHTVTSAGLARLWCLQSLSLYVSRQLAADTFVGASSVLGSLTLLLPGPHGPRLKGLPDDGGGGGVRNAAHLARSVLVGPLLVPLWHSLRCLRLWGAVFADPGLLAPLASLETLSLRECAGVGLTDAALGAVALPAEVVLEPHARAGT
jgi:hypothetical protein